MMKKEIDFKKNKVIVEITERQQIHISFFNRSEKKKGILLSEYVLRESVSVEGRKAFSVHIETIWVDWVYRRRQIGTFLMECLFQELLLIEKAEACKFILIYGEIGKGGRDNPRKSRPFYLSFHKKPFDEKRSLSVEMKENKDILETQFNFYIIENQ